MFTLEPGQGLCMVKNNLCMAVYFVVQGWIPRSFAGHSTCSWRHPAVAKSYWHQGCHGDDHHRQASPCSQSSGVWHFGQGTSFLFTVLHCPVHEMWDTLPTPVGACCIFMCPNNGCQCLGFLTCAQMLICAIAQGCCTDTVRESALKVDREKNLLPHQGLKPSSGLCLAFQSDTLPVELFPAPWLCVRYLNVSLYCAFLSLWLGAEW